MTTLSVAGRTRSSATALVLLAAGLTLSGCAASGAAGSTSPAPSETASVEPPPSAQDNPPLEGAYTVTELTSDGAPVDLPERLTATVVDAVKGPFFIDVLGLCTRVDITGSDWTDHSTVKLTTDEPEMMSAVGCSDELGDAVDAAQTLLTGTVAVEIGTEKLTLTQGSDRMVLQRAQP